MEDWKLDGDREGVGRYDSKQLKSRQLVAAADFSLWKRWQSSLGVFVVACVSWILFEHSELPFLTICSDVLLILIVILFVSANFAAILNRPQQLLPEFDLSEEMVNNVAASVRVKINNALVMAHDITLGKDFRQFFKVVVALWLLSAIGSYISFFTVAYVGTVAAITVPAFCSKYGEPVERYYCMIQRKFSQHYKIVDESVTNRFPRRIATNKDA